MENENDDDNIEIENEEIDLDFDESKIICNFCQCKNEDVFGFPFLSYLTRLPSIVNNKLHNTKKPIDQMEQSFLMIICNHNMNNLKNLQ